MTFFTVSSKSLLYIAHIQCVQSHVWGLSNLPSSKHLNLPCIIITEKTVFRYCIISCTLYSYMHSYSFNSPTEKKKKDLTDYQCACLLACRHASMPASLPVCDFLPARLPSWLPARVSPCLTMCDCLLGCLAACLTACLSDCQVCACLPGMCLPAGYVPAC